jgi:hypothetical protein
MPDRVNTAMNAVQTAGGCALRDAAARQAGLIQLSGR